MARTHGVALGLLALGMAGAACGPGAPLRPDLPKGTSTGEAFEGGVKCSAVRPPTEPDLMGWDPGSRANLSMLRSQGVVAVRYRAEGCNVELEVLSNCIGTGKYSYSPYAATDTKIAHNAQELYAELPIGAARLGGKLRGGRALRTDYTLVGMQALPVGSAYAASDLRGPDCERATHVVSRMYLGGFAMVAGETSAIEAAVSVFGAKAGGAQAQSAEHVAREGVAEACDKAQSEGKENAQCAVPLRVGLLAIAGRADGGCPAGSTFDGKACVQKQVVTQIECPPGSKLEGSRCVASVSTACTAGMHFEPGRGCVPDVTAQPASVAPSAPASPPGSTREGMALVPAGSFMMGSNDGDADEKPVHRVSVSAFSMDVTEVTVSAYEACVRAGACTADELAGAALCNWGKGDRKNHPINCVDWNQATAFCGWASKRLPTEEEWEYAARGSDGRKFPWGSDAPASQLCWNRSTNQGTCAVGSFAAGKSPFGLSDMAGNVWEWTSSGYSDDYSKNRTNAARVSRGGGWGGDVPSVVRSANRARNAPSIRSSFLGFRCARAQ